MVVNPSWLSKLPRAMTQIHGSESMTRSATSSKALSLQTTGAYDVAPTKEGSPASNMTIGPPESPKHIDWIGSLKQNVWE